MTCENDPAGGLFTTISSYIFFSLFFRASKIDFDVIILSSSSGVISGTDSIYLISQTPLRRVKKGTSGIFVMHGEKARLSRSLSSLFFLSELPK